MKRTFLNESTMRAETTFSRALLLVVLVYVAGAAFAHAIARTAGGDKQLWEIFLPSALALGVGLSCIERESLHWPKKETPRGLPGAAVASGVLAGLAAAMLALSEGHAIEMVRVSHVVHAVLVAPVVEEIIFTGFLYTVLRRNRSVTVSVLWISSLFAIAHSPSGISSVLARIAHSVVTCLIFESTGSLLLAMAQHFLSNLVPFSVALALGGRPALISVPESWLAGIGMALIGFSVLIPVWTALPVRRGVKQTGTEDCLAVSPPSDRSSPA